MRSVLERDHSDFLLKGQQEAAPFLVAQFEAVPSVALRAGLSAVLLLAPQLAALLAQLEAQLEAAPSVALRAGLSAVLLLEAHAARCSAVHSVLPAQQELVPLTAPSEA